MPQEIKSNIPRAPLKWASSDADYNQLVDATQDLSQRYADNYRQLTADVNLAAPGERFIGKIQDKPCFGDSGRDCTDARYYVARHVQAGDLNHDKRGTGKDLLGTDDDPPGGQP